MPGNMDVQFNVNWKKLTIIVPDLESVESKAAYHQGKHQSLNIGTQFQVCCTYSP